MVYIAHLGWNVVVALCGKGGEVSQAYLFTAKMGYELVSHNSGTFRLTLKKHPGTGMFYRIPLEISADKFSVRTIFPQTKKSTLCTPVYSADVP